MVITQQQIRRVVPDVNSKNLNAFVASLNMYGVHFGIDSPLRMAMYLSMTLHETGNLRYSEENMNYSAEGLLKTFPKYFNAETAKEYARNPQKIGSRVYANRMGNGNEASGDGYKFRGRGMIQITGRNMYQQFNASEWCTEDVVKCPEKLAIYPLDQVSAMWFWTEHGLNEVADNGDVDKATKIINGGINGLSNRKFLYRKFCREFGIQKI